MEEQAAVLSVWGKGQILVAWVSSSSQQCWYYVGECWVDRCATQKATKEELKVRHDGSWSFIIHTKVLQVDCAMSGYRIWSSLLKAMSFHYADTGPVYAQRVVKKCVQNCIPPNVPTQNACRCEEICTLDISPSRAT